MYSGLLYRCNCTRGSDWHDCHRDKGPCRSDCSIYPSGSAARVPLTTGALRQRRPFWDRMLARDETGQRSCCSSTLRKWPAECARSLGSAAAALRGWRAASCSRSSGSESDGWRARDARRRCRSTRLCCRSTVTPASSAASYTRTTRRTSGSDSSSSSGATAEAVAAEVRPAGCHS